MRKKIIACKTVENELLKATCHTDLEIIWLEPGLHNTPTHLKESIQTILNHAENVDIFLLAMGLCGNAMIGLRSPYAELIIPRVEDCISLMLGSEEKRKSCSGTYFMTEGWLKGEKNIWQEYTHTIKKYGEKRGTRIFDAMLRNYHTLALIDTGCYNIAPAAEACRSIADALHLEYTQIPGTCSYFSDLIHGPWPTERFIHLKAGETLTAEAAWL